MKKGILVFSLLVIFIITSCGKAAESREEMHRRAKEVQDSIANAIQSAINEELPAANAAPVAVPVVADTTHKNPK